MALLVKKKQYGFQFKRKNSWKYLGHKFNKIDVSDAAYCDSHNFLFDSDAEERKLYNAQPCHYTDSRYYSSPFTNSYGGCTILWSRLVDKPLKYLLNVIKEVRNASGYDFVIESDYYVKGAGHFKYIVKGSDNKFDPEYRIDESWKTGNFSCDPKAAALVDRLRAEGFIVEMKKNQGFLTTMLNTALAVTGKEPIENPPVEECCIAYGYGKKIGFSSNKASLFGYSYGEDNILYDYYGYFAKWSRCEQIPKDTDSEEIIKILKSERDEN